jgi:hypothetical protein
MMAAARACGSVLRSRRTQRRLVAGSKAAVQLQSWHGVVGSKKPYEKYQIDI